MAVYWVDKTSGDSGNSGTLKTDALDTIAAGIALMSNGDTLRIFNTSGAKDEYAESILTTTLDNIYIRGDSRDLVCLKPASGDSVLEIDSSIGVIIEGLELDGTNVTHSTLRVDRSYNLVKWCRTIAGPDGLFISSGADGNRIEDCEMTGANTEGATFNNCQDTTLVRCVSKDNGSDGYRDAHASNLRTTLIDCHAQDNGTSGFDFNGTGRAVVLQNCVSSGNGSADSLASDVVTMGGTAARPDDGVLRNAPKADLITAIDRLQRDY